MNRLALLLSLAVAIGSLSSPRRARACKPLGHTTHVINPAMQAMDQTPPTLPAIPPPELHFASDDSKGCGDDYCPDVGAIFIPALATDDWTKPGQIGYRLSLVAGTLAPGLSLPVDAIEPGGDRLHLYWDSTTGRPVDLTLQVVAIDLAGNESAPQTVRVAHDPGGACAIARGRPSRSATPWLALAAVLIAVHRSRRRPA
jgi:hypothetical protein